MRSNARDDEKFMHELDAAVRLKPSLASNIMLFSMAGFFAAALGWMVFFKIDEMTHGEGQVVPSSEIQVVQSLEGGVLKDLMVSEGDIVKKGQVLIKISDIASASQARGTQAQQESLLAKKARLDAEISGTALSFPPEVSQKAPDIVTNETMLYQSRKKEFANAQAILSERISSTQARMAEAGAKISRLSESKRILGQQLDITRKMVEQRAVPKLDELKLNREMNDINGQMNEASQERQGYQADIRAAQKELEDLDHKFRSEALEELNDVQSQISQLRENLTALDDRVDRSELRSPVDGIVNKISLKTIGGVIEPAMHLVEIVPVNDELKITARVPPNEIAFLHVGQPVKVKISAYDPQRYGSLDGELVRIGAGSVTDSKGDVSFEIQVRTQKNYLGDDDHPLPITPGMIAQTDIITGRRTILSYLMKPVLRAKDKALTER